MNNKFGGLDNNTGMLIAREYLSTDKKVSFMNKLLNMMLNPTINIMNELNDQSISIDDLSMIMSVYNSIRLDVDLFNLTILENNLNTMLLQDFYDKNKFYMISSGLVHDKKTDEICVLIDLYKKADDDAIDLLQVIKDNKPEIIAYLYMKELVSLSMKNYKNKFILANRARVEMFKRNKGMDLSLMDEGAVALAKMAIEFHTNSMLLDNFNSNSNFSSSSKLDFLIKNNFILYSSKYNYKMTQLEILDELLKDAILDYYDASNNQSMNLYSGAGNSSQNNSSQSQSDDNNQQSNGEENGNSNNSFDRNSSYSNRSDNNEDELNNESDNDDLFNDDSNETVSKPVSDDENKFLRITFKNNQNQIFFMKMPPKKEHSRYESLDSLDERRVDAIQDYIDCGLQKIKGSGVRDILEKIGAPINIPMDWEKELIRHVDKMTSNVLGNNTESTYIKPNIYTRHIAYLPGRRRIPVSVPNIFLMFDQSGSMSNNIIRKINYVIQYFYKKKYNITVMIHDYDQEIDDVEVYEFKPKSGNICAQLNDLVSSRIRCGGTSHVGVFKLMERYIDEVTSTNKKYNANYVLIASDLYSDIELIWQKYKWPKLLNNNNIFALCPDPDQKMPFGKTLYVS